MPRISVEFVLIFIIHHELLLKLINAIVRSEKNVYQLCIQPFSTQKIVIQWPYVWQVD